jgi:hypothetical protein
MRKIEDYRKHAEECRQLARRAAPGEHRDQLMNMAHTWDGLAEERQRQLQLQTEIVEATPEQPRAK